MQAKNYGRGYKSKVLITGITGFIGSELARRLIAEGYDVAGIMRQSPKFPANLEGIRGKAQLYYGDFREYYNMCYIVKDFQPDYVFHLGAITPVPYSFDHPIEVNMTNHIGTMNLAEACRMEIPGTLKKFIFASTMEVYGRQENVPLTESLKEVVPHPHSPYAVAKYAAEHYLFYLYNAFNFPVVVSRGSNCYGRKYDTEFLTEGAIKEMLENPNHVDKGEKDPVRSFLHIDDTVDFYKAIMESDNPAILGEVLNNGSYAGQGYSVEEWIEMIKKGLDWKGSIAWGMRGKRVGEIYYITTDNSKARKLLNWTPKVSEEEGIAKTIAYWRKQLGK